MGFKPFFVQKFTRNLKKSPKITTNQSFVVALITTKFNKVQKLPKQISLKMKFI